MPQSRVPIADSHSHSNPVRGMGAARIASRFKSVGGWFMALAALSPWSYAISFEGLDSYKEAIDIHVKECKSAEDEGLSVACLAGFHPADVDRLIDRYGMNPVDVLRLGIEVVEYVAGLCAEGVIDGIGEVGRQHYRTTPERVIISEMIMKRALELAKDNDCIVHLHLENQGVITVELVDATISSMGLGDNERMRVFFHHVKPGLAREAWRRGYPVTIPGVPRLVSHVVAGTEPFYMLESDYIDDPQRPGVVVYPWVMAEEEHRLLGSGKVSEEYLYKINVDNIVKYYGVNPP